MIEIALQGLQKTYNPGLFKAKVRAVSEMTLDVSRGEVFGLIGPNGAGKSTTIRMLIGLIRPDAGSILFRGAPLDETVFKREVGYLPENPYLYDHLTLEELLAFCAKSSGMDSSLGRQRGLVLTEKLGLSAARRRKLRTFSKGMLQRAGICFALLHDPAVIILDEPMSGLDPVGRGMVFDLILELKGEGKTVLFCSHILSDVERLCDRIGLMVAGRLERTYAQSDFLQESGPSVHLCVSPLSAGQRRVLEPLVEKIVDERQGHVLTVRPQSLSEVQGRLEEAGGTITGSRSQQVSLEELFMQVVEGK